MQLNWTELIPSNWSGPILLRSADYLRELQGLLAQHPTRVVHNSLLIVFALAILPPGQPDALVCTKAALWAMPEVSSALYVAQFSQQKISGAIARVRQIGTIIFFKAYLLF